MNKSLSCIALALLLLFAVPANATELTAGKVIAVKDGDTVVIAPIQGGEYFICRLYGIDAEEIQHGSTPGQPDGEAAKTDLKRLVLGKTVGVLLTGDTTYDRQVCIISYNGASVNLAMLQRGHAWAYRKYLKGPYVSEYINAERDARANHLGIWQRNNPQPPWEFRKAQNNRNR